MWLILSSYLRESKELVKVSNKELVKASKEKAGGERENVKVGGNLGRVRCCAIIKEEVGKNSKKAR